MKNTLILLAISLSALLVGCSKVEHRHHKVAKNPVTVHQYRQAVVETADDTADAINSFIYWYVILADNDTYYYRSASPVTSFAGVSFTRSAGSQLPKEVKEELEQAEELEAETIEEVADLPEELAAEVESVDMTETVDAETGDVVSDSVDSSASASDTSSSDVGSSDSGGSFDSGGGDAGGGGGE